MIEWIVEEPPPYATWLGVIARESDLATAEERVAEAERELSTSEKLLIAGLVLNALVFGFGVYQWRQGKKRTA